MSKTIYGGVTVGGVAVHAERLHGGAVREIYRVRIVRETKTLWVDDGGTKWRKDTGAMSPQYLRPRFVMTVPAYEVAVQG